MSETKTESTIDQKKALAVQAKKEAAEKAKLEKENKGAKAIEEKLKADAAKLATVTAEVTHLFSEVKSHVESGRALVASLTPESTVEIVQKAGEDSSEILKATRSLLKTIKATVKKVKEPGELAIAISTAQSLIDGLAADIQSIKSKVSEAKMASKAAEKQAAKEQREAAKAASAMPKQNDITRPRPDTACGNAWVLMDQLSAKLGQAVPISILLQAAEKKDLNEDTVKTQYARWKKFNGVEGRVAIPIPLGLLD